MKKVITFSFVALVIILTGVIYLIASAYLKLEKETTETEERECFTIEERIVNGGSLSGILEDGQTVKILFGYYDCNKIKKEDIVIYDYVGSKNPLIKIVKAIPGDRFFLKEAENSSGWNILVNDKIVTNSHNQPYILNGRRYRILSLYERDYKGIIPEESCLILSNIASGAVDSTLFGFVHKNDILGKVEI